MFSPDKPRMISCPMCVCVLRFEPFRLLFNQRSPGHFDLLVVVPFKMCYILHFWLFARGICVRKDQYCHITMFTLVNANWQNPLGPVHTMLSLSTTQKGPGATPRRPKGMYEQWFFFFCQSENLDLWSRLMLFLWSGLSWYAPYYIFCCFEGV